MRELWLLFVARSHVYVGEGDWPEKRVVFQIIVKTRDAFQALRIVQLLIWPDICNPPSIPARLCPPPTHTHTHTLSLLLILASQHFVFWPLFVLFCSNPFYSIFFSFFFIAYLPSLTILLSVLKTDFRLGRREVKRKTFVNHGNIHLCRKPCVDKPEWKSLIMKWKERMM